MKEKPPGYQTTMIKELMSQLLRNTVLPAEILVLPPYDPEEDK